MSLREKINADIKSAMKERQADVLSTLRMLSAALKNKEIELKKELEEEDIITIIKKQAKQLVESIETAVEAGRQELADKAKQELLIIKAYLPAELTDKEMESLVMDVIKDLAATVEDIGKVMGAVLERAKGRADGRKVKELVSKALGK